jgi:hypothetical protein
MREHSGVDGMHGRRLGDLFECGPDRKAPALSSHCSSLTGKSAQADARVLCMRLRGSSELIGGQFSVALRYLLVGSQRSRFAMSIAARVEVPSGDSALVGNATQRPQTLFCATRYSFWSRSCPFTNPDTDVNNRATCALFMSVSGSTMLLRR